MRSSVVACTVVCFVVFLLFLSFLLASIGLKSTDVGFWIATFTKPDRARMRQNLQTFAEVMHNHGIFFWLGEGTALGAIREGNIIEGDEDVDVGVWATDEAQFKDNVEPELLARGFRVGRPLPYGLYRNGEKLDVDFTGPSLNCMAVHWPSPCANHIELLQPFGSASIGSETYVVPSVDYLRHLYGDDWRTPKRGFKPRHFKRPVAPLTK